MAFCEFKERLCFECTIQNTLEVKLKLQPTEILENTGMVIKMEGTTTCLGLSKHRRNKDYLDIGNKCKD